MQIIKKHVRETDPSDFTNSKRMLNLNKVLENMSMLNLSIIIPKEMDRLLDSLEGIEGEHMMIDEIKGFVVGEEADDSVSPTNSQASSTSTLVEGVKHAVCDPLGLIKSLIYDRAMVMEKAKDIYNETKDSAQDKIYKCTTLYPSLIINKSKDKIYQVHDKYADVKQDIHSKITSIVNERIYEPLATNLHSILKSSVEIIHSNPLVATLSKSPVIKKVFNTTLDKVKSSSILSKPYYKVERMFYGVAAGLVPYPKTPKPYHVTRILKNGNN